MQRHDRVICTMCQMYKDKIFCGKQLHVKQYPCNNIAKGKIMSTCMWLLEASITNKGCKQWMQAMFGIHNIDNKENYTQFLFSTGHSNHNSLYNYFLVVARLFEFVKNNNYNKTPKQL